ncbi:translation initiation factor eIF-2B subunit epsilon [Cocos nucifera]|uniref:Translation initiation factor eIF2B subunit epsilon n=1 Tax=Cocos nucifera TaxID=13894 RepID=A0A8K0N0C1_COCNU|nr:translation initiation factor eIF-2B subunit epsilon [Cocos nucifera]
MAPKKGHRFSSSEDPEELARVPLQAILLADSFATKFRPITLERPKVLLPLVNAPMIDYTLAWLESVGVEEAFVFCCAHSQQVKDYLNKSQWMKQPGTFTVQPIESHDSIGAGDALRVIYNLGVIRGDFVLVSGDTVSNMSLKEALQEHKERRKKDPLAVMTMVIKHSKPSSLTHQTRLGNDEILMAIDPDTKELLYYEDKTDQSQRFITLDKMLLASTPTLHLHNDKQLYRFPILMRKRLIPVVLFLEILKDCYIDICSPEVLSLFTDNFDYQHLRRHFVKGLLVDDLMGYKIFTHEIHSSYAARIDNFRSYDTISKDIIQRWTYPMVPDVQYFGNCSQMKLDRLGIYKAPEVDQSRTAQIRAFSLIGNGTTIGDHSVISYSVIGQSCSIGRNVSIQGSYIWDNVIIEDDCKLSHALVCDGVHMRYTHTHMLSVKFSFIIFCSKAYMMQKAISASVVNDFFLVDLIAWVPELLMVEVGQKIVIPAYSKVSLLPQPSKQDSDEELEYADANSGVVESPYRKPPRKRVFCILLIKVGISGVGYIWSTTEGGHEEEWRQSIAPIPAEKLMEFSLSAHTDLGVSNQDVNSLPASGELQLGSEGTGFDDGEDYKDSADFEKELEATFQRALAGVNPDNVILEINSLRLSYNMAHADCAGSLFYSIMKSALSAPFSSNRELLLNTGKELSRWKDLLKNYLKTIDEEIEVLLKFEEMCLETTKEFAPLFSAILNHLYEKDILSEDAILSWAEEKEGADESDKIFVKQSEPFLKLSTYKENNLKTLCAG